ncbi:MAG: 3-dehydroquinate synthase [Bacteroidetes bacterium]|nr:3-dehydroquinate synthase [Bacteroidota bacterium]
MSNVKFYSEIKSLQQQLQQLAAGYSATFILCDEHTEEHCLPRMRDALPDAFIIRVRSGEQYKNLGSCDIIWFALTHHHADRRALLINLGGGVICDMGGFAASCYKRGIDFIHVPTTLLAMADASIGGKTGIDFDHYKNQIGLFRPAAAVLICPAFLTTLDQRQLRSGLAEVIKHYLIADAAAFRGVEQNEKLSYDLALIARAVQIKSQFAEADPDEQHIRKALNYGHTIGHAIESHRLRTDVPLLHGEAIAMGMAVEALIAQHMDLLAEADADRVLAVLHRLFDLPVLSMEEIAAIVTLSAQDKKNTGATRRMALIDAIGSYVTDVAVGEEQIREACIWYNNGIS